MSDNIISSAEKSGRSTIASSPEKSSSLESGLSKHVERLSKKLDHPEALSPQDVKNLRQVMRKAVEFEPGFKRAENKQAKINDARVKYLHDKILHLERIKEIATDLYYGDGHEASNWIDLIKQIDSYNMIPRFKKMLKQLPGFEVSR